MRINLPLLFLAFALSLAACGRNHQRHNVSYVNVGDDGLIPDMEYVFNPFDSLNSIDKTRAFDIFLLLRYSEICKIQSLPVEIETGSLASDNFKSENFNVDLFGKKQQDEAKGSFGIYELSYPLFRNLKPDEGFFLSVKTPEKNTSGIYAIGILCKETEI